LAFSKHGAAMAQAAIGSGLGERALEVPAAIGVTGHALARQHGELAMALRRGKRVGESP
jgi:hypothetical protein